MCDSCARLKNRLLDLEARLTALEQKFPKDIVIIPLSKNEASEEGQLYPPFLLPEYEDSDNE